jgi:hypothetical protein
MRLAVMLACLTAGLSYQALAQSPAATATPATEAPNSGHPPDASSTMPVVPAATTPAATSTAPAATASAAAATSADAEADAQLLKRLRSQGYTPYMQNGQKVLCRREEVMGASLHA